MFLLVLTVSFSHFLFGFNAKPAEPGVLFRFHLSLFNVNKSVTKVQTFIYADNTAFTERLQIKCLRITGRMLLSEKLFHKQLWLLGIAALDISHHGETGVAKRIDGIEGFLTVERTKGDESRIVEIP